MKSTRTTAQPERSPIYRIAVFAYGAAAYVLGVGALLALILIMLGVLPFTGGPLGQLGLGAGIALDALLLVGFALQHSVMARTSFKACWTRIIPAAAERSTYVLATAIALVPLLLVWQPMPAIVWSVDAPILRWAVLGVALAGWAYLFAASFAIDHFELFGLQQVYRALSGRAPAEAPFAERWMYRFDRHPIMSGMLIGVWVTPTMTLDHLLFAAGCTAYVWIGVFFEERSLRRQWGRQYEAYCERVGTIVPTFASSMPARILLVAFSVAAGLNWGSAFAQQTTPPAAQELSRVTVTGSNIRRTESETASPVQTLTRDDIEKSGKSSVAELLQTLAVDNQGSVPTTFGRGFASGASGISLRGLGAASTLVLVNGRRIAPYGLADDGQKVFADLNMIPLEAVDRIEILKDGASSIYGSDAIAGVVNIILRRDFNGVVGKVTYGQSRYGDGADTRATLTAGFGTLEADKFNLLFNLEAGKKNEIWNRDRAGRGAVGRTDLRDLGFDATTSSGVAGLGGTGAITGNNAAGSAINGNVRNPATLDYYNRGNLAGVGFTRTFADAACSNFTDHPQGDPGGGCLIDASQRYGQIQPSQESINFFTRGSLQLPADLQAYAELNLYNNKSKTSTTPSTVSGNVGFPGGPVSNASIALGADHPDNPYFGTAARLRYLAADVGPRVNRVDSTFTRLVAGLKGSFADWEFDTAVLYSQSKVKSERTGFLQRDVSFALLNPGGFAVQPGSSAPSTLDNAAVAAANSPAYAALPVGSFWRIAENAKLNSAALYAALSPNVDNDALSKTAQIDFKVSREVAQLAGGGLGVALGAEFRRESIRLDPAAGTERGNIIGLGYSAYSGRRDVSAAYAEVVAPVVKAVELSGALRLDHYSDVGNAVTPKLGVKWTPAAEFALRGTYAEGFRAPSSAENGTGGLAAFSTASDPVRCALGVQAACTAGPIALITSPNPGLVPEKAKSFTLGFVWAPAPKTSLSLDLWQIERKNEINQEQTAAAIAAGQVARDPSTADGTVPGDPGAITAVLVNYVNSASAKVQGIDLDARQGFDLAGAGKLTLDAKWTHLFKWLRTEQDGSRFDFAGTHGNCDVTNCIGTPADRVNLGATWELGPWRVAAAANYRGPLSNKRFKDDPDGCISFFADGSEAPAGCRIGSFTTVDLTARWRAAEKLEVFGSIQNLFDRVPPLDTATYGAVSYNPLDYSGAVGRFFSLGLKYRF